VTEQADKAPDAPEENDNSPVGVLVNIKRGEQGDVAIESLVPLGDVRPTEVQHILERGVTWYRQVYDLS
jgi:hypothetical protein